MCAHSFNLDTSTSICPPAANIGVTVFATNVLGNGSTSEPTFQGTMFNLNHYALNLFDIQHLDGVNNFVDINFNSETTTIICTFLNQPVDTTKQCSFNITYGPNCDQQLGSYTSEGTGDSVSSPELPLLEDVSEYCFTVTARSNNVTVSVEGTLNLIEVFNVIGKSITNSKGKILYPVLFYNLGVATAAAVVPVVIVFVMGGVVTALFLIIYYQLRQSLIVIRFSNPDKSGSLAQMLKLFKVI